MLIKFDMRGNMSIGKNIRRLRKEAGMSQEQLGAKLGKTRSAVSQYESETIIPRMGVIEDLAQIFRVSKSEIIGERKKPNNANLTYAEQHVLDVMRTITPTGIDELMKYADYIQQRYSKNYKAEKTA